MIGTEIMTELMGNDDGGQHVGVKRIGDAGTVTVAITQSAHPGQPGRASIKIPSAHQMQQGAPILLKRKITAGHLRLHIIQQIIR